MAKEKRNSYHDLIPSIRAVFSLECGFCGETTETLASDSDLADIEQEHKDYAQEWFDRGWRVISPKGWQVTDVACPDCVQKHRRGRLQP